MKIVNMNILDVTDGIIVHQVNCKKVMGAGLAASIRKKYPQHYEDYMHHNPKLGSGVVTTKYKPVIIIGIYGQDGYGRDRVQTNYQALANALHKVSICAEQTGKQVYIPYKLGCGLAGGNWDIVSKIIEKYCSKAIVCKL